MHTFLTILVGILLLATLGVLLAGVIGMAGQHDPRRSNKLMRWRIVLQAGALILLMIMMSLLRS
ncbi:twin transmembrane helix small protein [Rhodopila globiformis]|uniref:Twin transmembrane helix small protein n=1 Tax=Rhodopila globiformis TaxID=1071 RepID=A0A2S6NNN0_RHOGL|nr:twin transmembrane helix small protein [Rhodopila globiformis]PPQ39234.1 twin transmembrane helix small protein [Rhodopila globiformis]